MSFSEHIVRTPTLRLVMVQEPLDWVAAAADFNTLANAVLDRALGWQLSFDAAFGRDASADIRLVDSIEEIVSGNSHLFAYNEVHYRLFAGYQGNSLTTICAQNFDYVDYDSSRFIGEHYFRSEEDAIAAASHLEKLVGGRMDV